MPTEISVGITFLKGVFSMQPFESAQMNDYFSSLPPVVQQSILQSGTAPKTMADLQNLAMKMTDGHQRHYN